ncbi:MAG: hypothetical protein U0165_19910 [Polyangiaceae bacterium]
MDFDGLVVVYFFAFMFESMLLLAVWMLRRQARAGERYATGACGLLSVSPPSKWTRFRGTLETESPVKNSQGDDCVWVSEFFLGDFSPKSDPKMISKKRSNSIYLRDATARARVESDGLAVYGAHHERRPAPGGTVLESWVLPGEKVMVMGRLDPDAASPKIMGDSNDAVSVYLGDEEPKPELASHRLWNRLVAANVFCGGLMLVCGTWAMVLKPTLETGITLGTMPLLYVAIVLFARYKLNKTKIEEV